MWDVNFPALLITVTGVSRNARKNIRAAHAAIEMRQSLGISTTFKDEKRNFPDVFEFVFYVQLELFN